ncbi:hypothetical protein [Vibrio alginolyticus]|uniref:hypothetical protein n=1 Tax=Vibrio alginolyticus TaxID=663 RepID=UPI0021D0CFDB
MSDLNKIIDNVLEGVRTPPAVIDFIPVLPVTKSRFRSLIERCIEVQKQLVDIDVDSEEYFDLQKVVYEIESDYRATRARLLFLPAFTLIYFGFFAVFSLFLYVDIPSFIKTTLGVEAPEKLVTMGIAGAFIYFITDLLKRMDSTEVSQGVGVLKFTIQLTLAVLVPIILVSLFFDGDGKLSELSLSPELLSFVCGYSSKLVIDTMNKVVEKVTKMLQAF